MAAERSTEVASARSRMKHATHLLDGWRTRLASYSSHTELLDTVTRTGIVARTFCESKDSEPCCNSQGTARCLGKRTATNLEN